MRAVRVFLHSLVFAREKREDQSIARMTVLAVALAFWELGSAINLKSGTVQISQPTLQTPEVQMHFLLMFQKNKQALGHTSQPDSNSTSWWFIQPSSYQKCYLFLKGSSALLKTALILADKPANSGNSDGLLDFFLESVLNLWWELLMTAAFFPLGLVRPPFGLITPNCVSIVLHTSSKVKERTGFWKSTKAISGDSCQW